MMAQHLSPPTELLMAAHRAEDGETARLARAVATLDGLMLAPHVAALRDAAQAWLDAPGSEAAARALQEAMATYCRTTTPERRARMARAIASEDLAALAGPAWTERADLQ